MIFRPTESITVYSSWKAHDPKKITRRLFELGYELSSRFETIYFFQVWKWSFMVDVFDHKAASEAREFRMIDHFVPPPPAETQAAGAKIVKFPARSGR